MSTKIKTRLYVDAALAAGAQVDATPEQAGLLLQTLRCKGGEHVALFNGRDGEWLAHVQPSGKRSAELHVVSQRTTQAPAPDIWLAFAPVKNEKIDFLAKRAVELGASVLLPVMTQHTIVTRVNEERLRANVIEAAEQCGRMDVPAIRAPQKLDMLLSTWPRERRLLYCDESGDAKSVRDLLPTLPPGPCGALIGPEGGFSAEERRLIRTLPFVQPIHLGPRILRAETAALCILSHLVAWAGDGELRPHFIAEEL